MLPPKQQAQIQGYTLDYVISGSGTPPIVLVNGAGGPMEGWYKVYGELEKLSTVFAYHRPGRADVPQTGEKIASVLRELLTAVRLKPPYLLVGHSLGGLYVNLYARKFPAEVAGVVLLDAAAPGDETLQKHQTTLQRFLNGILGAIFPKDKNAETEQVVETVHQIKGAGNFPDVPLRVVSGGQFPRMMPPEAVQIRKENQKALSALSRYGKQIIAARSGHFPQFSEPEVVIEAVKQCLTN